MSTISCPKCGSKNSPKSSFCGNCGEKINHKETKKSCSACGIIANEHDKFCPECGFSLTQGSNSTNTPKSFLKQTIKKKTKRLSRKTSTPHPKKKKGGILRTIGKVFLGTITLLIISIVALYIIGDRVDESTVTNSESKYVTSFKAKKANAVLTKNRSFPILSSSQEQVFNYSDSLSINLPPNFTSKKQTLSVSKAEADPEIWVEDFMPLLMVDLTIDNGKQPPQPIFFRYKYDSKKLNPNFSAEAQLAAFRWDEEEGVWKGLPVQINVEENEILVLTDHLSIFEIGLAVVEIVSRVKAHVDAKDKEKLTGIYITPQKNFRLMYSKEEISRDGSLMNARWKNKYHSSGRKYSNKHPLFIQDAGAFLEEALDKYTNTYDFLNPAGKHKNVFGGTFNKMITVKMDSYLNDIKWPIDLSDPFYDKLQERLYIPTSRCLKEKPAKLTLAHELFHAVQAQYYGRSGMYDPRNQWWLEATAEYASFEIAYSKLNEGIGDECGSNFLTFPINDRGAKNSVHGWDQRHYEYLSSIWIKYIIDNGGSFKQMIADGASDWPKSPIKSLERYLYARHNKSMAEIYRKFSHWMMLSPNSYLKKFPLANINTGKKQQTFIATHNSELMLGSGKEIKYTYALPGNYSSKLWAIKVTKDSLDKKNEKKPLLVNVKSKTDGVVVDIFVLTQGERFLTPPKPTKSIYVIDKPAIIFTSANDLVLITATQGGIEGSSAEVFVSDAGIILEIKPPELPNAKAREANDFTITAKNIPEEIENVTFEWDYNDGSEKGIRDFVTVINGEAEQKISHRYEESEKEEIYPLKAILKEAGKNTILSAAEALVTLRLETPVLSVSPGIAVGPPGATFDMEAKAYPQNTYKFVWEISGFSEGFTQEGIESGVAPIIDAEGEYSVTVKLYDLSGNYLDMVKASISVQADELDTKGVDGIVSIDDDSESETGHWVLYDTKEINGCQFYESECWPLVSCTGGDGSYSITVGSSTCGSNAAGDTGSGTYSPPPFNLIAGETINFKTTASGAGYTSVSIMYYNDIKKMRFDEKGGNIGDSPKWKNKIVSCKENSSPANGEYKIPESIGKEGALVIEGGGSIGNFVTSRYKLYLYKWLY